MKRSAHSRNETAILLVARNIRAHRIARKLTIEELAFKMNVDYSQLSRMERAKVNFSISTLFNVAEALQVDPAVLLREMAIPLPEADTY